MSASNGKINNCIVISDTHCGDQLALCPKRFRLRHGGWYYPSKFQKFINECWKDFWNVWVPQATRGEPYCIVLNGDAMEGRHHKALHPISQDLSDQEALAYEVLAPVLEKAKGGFYSCSPQHGTQMGPDEARKLAPLAMSNVGFLIGMNADKTAWILAANVSQEAQFRDFTVIPLVNVIRKRMLK